MNPKRSSPDRQQSLEIINAAAMLPNILSHSLMVCRVSTAIVTALAENGIHLDYEAVQASALLHDITKTRSIETGENHAETGARFLKELGYDTVADIVRQHISPKNGDGSISEAEVVSYADKRVLHDRLVSLNERFDYLFKRYGKNQNAVQRILALKEKIEKIEAKIFTAIKSDIIIISENKDETI